MCASHQVSKHSSNALCATRLPCPPPHTTHTISPSLPFPHYRSPDNGLSCCQHCLVGELCGAELSSSITHSIRGRQQAAARRTRPAGRREGGQQQGGSYECVVKKSTAACWRSKNPCCHATCKGTLMQSLLFQAEGSQATNHTAVASHHSFCPPPARPVCSRVLCLLECWSHALELPCCVVGACEHEGITAAVVAVVIKQAASHLGGGRGGGLGH